MYLGGLNMIKDYSFKEIKKYLKKDSAVGTDILNAFDSLTDAAIIFAPIAFGVQFLPLLELLEVKGKLFELGHKVYNSIANRIEANYIDRIEQIKAAYALICYTAYFDALQDILPSKVRKKLKLKLDDKKKLIETDNAVENQYTSNTTLTDIHCNVYYADHITSFSEVKEKVFDIYGNITKGLLKTIAEASIFDEEKESEIKEWENLKNLLSTLPQKAIEFYEAQYLDLADHFSDFALFAQLQNFDGMHRAIKDNKNAIDLLTDITSKIDVGLNNLNEIITSIPMKYREIQAQNIVDELKRKYIAIINEPIINDEEIKPDSETIRLTFPKIVDAFIPQSYKCLSYHQKGIKLEDPSVWENISTQNDIDKFFIKYLYALDSIDYPLIVLGQPGSGKSLLTKVLAAQLMSKSYTVIWIPLRDVNAEDDIDILVEDQIKKITNRPLSTDGYGGFASQFNEKPLIIILDGYDELLQAKGSVFSGYLEKVRTFQQNQKQLNRPVRIIVTSRITLIDKARIPVNSTVLRLMEFDQQQRHAWINIWNSTNSEYFINNSILPFKLPEKGKKNNIIELAEQPLLLLMLALYDSESNELAKNVNIKRTELYDNLIRRFIRRERSRYILDFDDKTQAEQDLIIDNEMNRLGVIAIGMYNRRDVVILSEQLEKDLTAFHAHKDIGIQAAHPLTDADSVLGGFFFIHKSTAQEADANSETATNAYEFLHNTFGEFLAADFILRNTIIEVKDAYVDRNYKSFGTSSAALRVSPDSLKSNWFYCLMFVPLYTRPVVVEMLREHASKALNRFKQIQGLRFSMSKEDFVDNLKYIVENQLRMVLNTRDCPKEMRNGILFDNDLPLLGYLSTYSLNLIILATALIPKGFEFNENDYRTTINELDLNPWDKLTSLWKAWFAPADLVGLSVILKATRNNKETVRIECNDKFEATEYEQPIDVLLCLSVTLADMMSLALAGLQTEKFQEISHYNSAEIKEALKAEGYDLFVRYLISMLRREMNSQHIEKNEIGHINFVYSNINCIIEEIFDDQRIMSINYDTRLELFEILETCLSKKLVFFKTRGMLVKLLPRLLEQHWTDSRYMGDSLLSISSSKLLQLLVPGKDIAPMSKKMLYSEFRYHSTLFGGEWAEDFEEILHFSFRRKYSDYIFIPSYNEDKSHQVRLLKTIEKSHSTRTKEYVRILEQFIEPDNLEVLMQTDPELPTYAILLLLKGDEYPRILNSYGLELFFKHMCELCSTVGIGYIGFDVVANAIEIAKKTKNFEVLSEINHILQKQFFGNSPELLSYIVYSYPEFIERLTILIPEFFYGNLPEMIESFALRRKYRYNFDHEKLFSYIRAFRSIYRLCAENESRIYGISPHFSEIIDIVAESIEENNVIFEVMTIQQAEDILWLIDNTKNARLKKNTKNKINKFVSITNRIKGL